MLQPTFSLRANPLKDRSINYSASSGVSRFPFVCLNHSSPSCGRQYSAPYFLAPSQIRRHFDAILTRLAILGADYVARMPSRISAELAERLNLHIAVAAMSDPASQSSSFVIGTKTHRTPFARKTARHRMSTLPLLSCTFVKVFAN